MAGVPRILLVEDDGNISYILKAAMRGLGMAHEVDIAYSTDEALDLWRAQPYDLVMTDYNLRGRNGLELISSLKAEGATAPMVLFTAYDTAEVWRNAKRAGVSKFIAKPFFMDEFVEVARGLLPRELAVSA